MVAKIDETPLLVIVGETASGKSDLALKLATKMNGEIICADSWTVRKYMDIGTAKPSQMDQLKTPHHLLDLVNPDENFTAVIFKRLAMQRITEITNRNKLPILVGGTGLYVDSVIYDYSFLPIGDENDRAYLERLTMTGLLALIHEQKLSLDNIDIRNKRRLIRLLQNQGIRPTKKPIRQNTVVLGIEISRDDLLRSIQKRVDLMIETGLEREVRLLTDRYGWALEGMKGVGYAQWKEYFEGTQSLEETRLRMIKATLALAKKQRTWFKRNKSIHWLSYPIEDNKAVDIITTLLYK